MRHGFCKLSQTRSCLRSFFGYWRHTLAFLAKKVAHEEEDVCLAHGLLLHRQSWHAGDRSCNTWNTERSIRYTFGVPVTCAACAPFAMDRQSGPFPATPSWSISCIFNGRKTELLEIKIVDPPFKRQEKIERIKTKSFFLFRSKFLIYIICVSEIRK